MTAEELTAQIIAQTVAGGDSSASSAVTNNSGTSLKTKAASGEPGTTV